MKKRFFNAACKFTAQIKKFLIRTSSTDLVTLTKSFKGNFIFCAVIIWSRLSNIVSQGCNIIFPTKKVEVTDKFLLENLHQYIGNFDWLNIVSQRTIRNLRLSDALKIKSQQTKNHKNAFIIDLFKIFLTFKFVWNGGWNSSNPPSRCYGPVSVMSKIGIWVQQFFRINYCYEKKNNISFFMLLTCFLLTKYIFQRNCNV